MKNKIHLQGQSLFELLGAIAVIGIILIAIVALATRSIKNSTLSSNTTEATKFSQEALEWAREQRDIDWNSFAARGTASGSTYCLDTLSWDNSGTCSSTELIPDTRFKRQATLMHNPATSPNSVEVDIVTSWDEGGATKQSRSTTKLTNWKNK